MNKAINHPAGSNAAQAASEMDEHRLRSERIAAQGIRFGAGKTLKYLLPLAGLAVLASVAFAAQA